MTHGEAAEGKMVTRYEQKMSLHHKVAEVTVVLVCSLSPSLVILMRSAACFPRDALMLLLKAKKRKKCSAADLLQLHSGGGNNTGQLQEMLRSWRSKSFSEVKPKHANTRSSVLEMCFLLGFFIYI